MRLLQEMVRENDSAGDIDPKTTDRKAVMQELTEKRTDASSAFYQCGYYDLKANYEQDQSIILVIRVLTGGFVTLCPW